MKKHILFFAVLFALGTFFTACNQDDNETVPVEDEVATSEDEAMAQNLVEDVEYVVDVYVEFRDPTDPTTDPNDDCPTITVEPADGSFPRTVTIDFGPDGCEGPNGRVRRGQIVINWTAALMTPGAERTVTFVDFFVDDAQVEGTKTLTNLGLNADDNPALSRTADITVTYPSGLSTNWTADHTLTMTAGFNTPPVWDNVFEITGTTSGLNRFGTAYSVTITEPLVKRKNCPWVVSGVKEIVIGDSIRTLNYGEGNCDRFATVTFPNGFTRQIRVHAWWRP